MKNEGLFNAPEPIFKPGEQLEDIGQVTPLTATFGSFTPTTTNGFQVTITYNKPICRDSFKSSEIEVLDSSNVVQTGWRSAHFDQCTSLTDRFGIFPPIDIPTSGQFRLRIPANVITATDGTTGPATAVTSSLWQIDYTPRVTISRSNIRLDGQKIKIDLTFSQNVTGIDISNVNIRDISRTPGSSYNIQNGWIFDTLSSTSAMANTPVTISVTPPANTNGNFSFFMDVFANPSARDSGLTNEFYINNTVTPTIALMWNDASFANNRAEATLTPYGGDISGLDSGDIVITRRRGFADQANWTLNAFPTSITSGTSTTISANYIYTQLSPGYAFGLRHRSIIFSGQSSTFPIEGLTGQFFNTLNSYPADFTSISFDPNLNRLNVNLQLSETRNNPIGGLSVSDFEIIDSNGVTQAGWVFGAIPSIPFASRANVPISITPPANTTGNFHVKLKANSLIPTDRDIDTLPVADTISPPVSVDNRGGLMVATATWGAASYDLATNKISANIQFSQNVTGIESGDFEVIDNSNTVQTGWTFDPPSSSSINANTDVLISALAPQNMSGTFRLRIKALSVNSGGSMAANAPVTAQSTNTVAVDTRSELSTEFTEPFGNQINPTSEFILTLDTAIPAIELTASDFTVNGGASIASISPIIGSSSTYQIIITNPVNSSGSYTVTLNANAISAGATYSASPPSAIVSESVSYDTRGFAMIPGTPVISPSDRSVNIPLNMLVDPEMGFDAEMDLDIQKQEGTSPPYSYTPEPPQNWDISGSNSGTTRTITAKPSVAVPAGAYRVVFRADALGVNRPRRIIPSVAFQISNPFPIATATWSNINGGLTLSGTCTFTGAAITGISRTDFEVLDSSDDVQSNWCIRVSLSSVADGGAITVTATPPANTNGSFKLRLKADSVNSGGSTIPNAPASEVISADSATVNNTADIPDIAVATWSNIVGGASLSGTLTFQNADVTNIEIGDFNVLDSTNTIDSDWVIAISSSSATAGTSITVTATTAASKSGNFKLQLNSMSIRSDGSSTDNAPENDITSIEIPIDTSSLDGRSSYTVTIPIPQGSQGSIQLSLKDRTFNVSGQPTQIGPSFQQYLGTISYDTEIVPEIVNIVRPDVLQGNGVENEILIDFNVEVQGLSSDDFLLEGMDPLPTFDDMTIKYGPTQNPDVSLTTEQRNLDIAIGITRAKYYKLILTFPNDVPSGILNIYLRNMAVNND